MVRNSILRAIFCLTMGCSGAFAAIAQEQATFESLFSQLPESAGLSPNNAAPLLDKLRGLQPTFTPDQNERFLLYSAYSLGVQGKHAQKVALIESTIGQVASHTRRARFLYELIDGYTALGNYEPALRAMNDAILLLPKLPETSQKMVVLQGAVNLLNALRAYDEALDFVDRMYALRDDTVGSYAACVGLTNRVESNFMRANNAQARTLVPDAIAACKANKKPFFVLIVKTYAAIDLIDSGSLEKGIATSLPLLQDYSHMRKNSDYLTQLEEAVARAYLQTKNTTLAEYFGLKAYQRAQAS